MIIGFDGRYAEDDLVGVGKYIQNLVLRLAKNGIICIIFYSKKPKVKIPGVTSIILSSRNRYYFEQILIPISIIKYKIDIYHALGNVGIPLFTKIPTILTIHDVIPLEFVNYFADSNFPLFSKFSYMIRFRLSTILASKIVTISKFTKVNLIKNYAVYPNKIRVINSGINVPSEVSKLPGNIRRKQYLINNGGIDLRKNQERLIRAFNLIKGRFSRMKLVITGNNPNIKPKLESLVKTLGLTQAVHFTGYIDEVVLWTLIKNSAVVVYPSLMEGFGSPVLEGFAAGIPVVSSNTTSIPEIAEDAAILVDPYDIFEIAQGVTKILANKTLEERLVIKGKRIVWKYNWERAANEYIDLYKFSSNSGK